MESNRPGGRKRKIVGQGQTIHKRDDALNTGGPVGRKDGYAGRRPGGQSQKLEGNSGTSSYGGSSADSFLRTTKGKGSMGFIVLIAIVLLVVFVLKPDLSCLGNLAGGGDQSGDTGLTDSSTLASLMNDSFSNGGAVSSGWDYVPEQQSTQQQITTQSGNTGLLDTQVASGAREKRTVIRGNNQDTVTLMVYMCGTDLESKYGMATNDLNEMIQAGANNPNLNVIVMTGGCKQWKNNVISNSVNQIYKVANGGVARLSDNFGSDAMTKPATLTKFINFCTQNFPANRYELIFWDHGGGSVSGYGYDEKYASSGSMSLKGINEALKASGTTFDFIGFDACLMATLENALMLEPYADYMIASEETEPGVGWYYTNWLKTLNNNTSTPTLDIGKMIVDDFVAECNRTCQGQKTTLSVVDLAELKATVPEAFRNFAVATTNQAKTDYSTVSKARSNAREFATQSKIDQVDLVHLARNLGTNEGKALANAILGAVKYNKTSSNMTNCYGLSIFFPYKASSKVSSAVATYNAIGLDSEYSRCIQQVASMSTAGQAVGSYASSGSVSQSSPYSSLLGSSGGSILGGGDISDLLGSLVGGGDLTSLLGGGGDFFGRNIDVDAASAYIADHQLDASKLVWTQDGGRSTLTISEEQWDLVQGLLLNVFVDDGSGYIDLGLDNIYEFTKDGKLIGEYDKAWLGIDGQACAYYYMDEYVSGNTDVITGRVPCLITHEDVAGNTVTDRAYMILVCTNGDWAIAGAVYDYVEGETETVAKSMAEIPVGATIELICDYYSYTGEYLNTYKLGEAFTYTGNNIVGDYEFNDMTYRATYMFTDIYGREYWTTPMP